MVSLTGTAEQLSSQKVAIVLQKGKIEIPEEFHMLVLYSQLLWRVPVDHLLRRTTNGRAVKKLLVSSGSKETEQ